MNHKPTVNVSLHRLNSLQRAVESFRYVALSIEVWISPEGNLRKWVKANTRLAVFMAVPTLMVFPVVTMALWELESWMSSLTTMVSKFIALPILTLLALMIACRIIRIFKP